MIIPDHISLHTNVDRYSLFSEITTWYDLFPLTINRCFRFSLVVIIQPARFTGPKTV